jgi:hypothetical protein
MKTMDNKNIMSNPYYSKMKNNEKINRRIEIVLYGMLLLIMMSLLMKYIIEQDL